MRPQRVVGLQGRGHEVGMDEKRFLNRRDLLSNLDVGFSHADQPKDVEAMRSLLIQATDMLTNPKTRRAFDLETECLQSRNDRGLAARELTGSQTV